MNYLLQFSFKLLDVHLNIRTELKLFVQMPSIFDLVYILSKFIFLPVQLSIFFPPFIYYYFSFFIVLNSIQPVLTSCIQSYKSFIHLPLLSSTAFNALFFVVNKNDGNFSLFFISLCFTPGLGQHKWFHQWCTYFTLQYNPWSELWSSRYLPPHLVFYLP